MSLDVVLRDLAHSDPRVRAQAADALGRSGPMDRDGAVKALVGAIDDAQAAVRYAALLSLGELSAVEAVAEVAARLSDGEPLVREAAAIALGGVGGEAAWAPLTEALKSGQPEVRFQAVTSLAELDAPRAAPLVREALADSDAKVRAQAAAALGDARDPDAVEPLAKLLLHSDAGDDPRGEVRYEAALALARLGDRRGVATLVAALDRSERALDAATALAEVGVAGEPAALAALGRELARFFGDKLVKVRAAEALARAGDPRGREHLEKAAKAGREDVRGLAEDVLGRLRTNP